MGGKLRNDNLLNEVTNISSLRQFDIPVKLWYRGQNCWTGAEGSSALWWRYPSSLCFISKWSCFRPRSIQVVSSYSGPRKTPVVELKWLRTCTWKTIPISNRGTLDSRDKLALYTSARRPRPWQNLFIVFDLNSRGALGQITYYVSANSSATCGKQWFDSGYSLLWSRDSVAVI